MAFAEWLDLYTYHERTEHGTYAGFATTEEWVNSLTNWEMVELFDKYQEALDEPN